MPEPISEDTGVLRDEAEGHEGGGLAVSDDALDDDNTSRYDLNALRRRLALGFRRLNRPRKAFRKQRPRH